MNGMGNRLLSILGLLIALVGIVFGGNLVLVIIGYVILGLEQMIKDKEESTASGMDEIIKESRETEKDDYISITLTDEIDPYKPKEQLERIFSHILEIRVDNQRTRTKLKEMDEELVMKDPFTSFAEFYKEMQGREMNGEEETIMKEIFDKAKGVE